MVDATLNPISEELRALRQKKFDELVVQNQSDQIKLQVADTSSLGLTKNDLQDSQKVSQMMVIGQRPFKVTCYFIECLKNFDQLPDAIFSW